MMKLSQQSKGGLALFAAAGIYGTFGVLARELALMFSAYGQVVARIVVALCLILVINAFRRNLKLLPRADTINALMMGAIFGVSVIFFTISIEHTKIASTITMLYAGSIITALLLGTWLLKEKLTMVKVLATILAGVGLVVYSGITFALSIGILTGLLAGVTDGMANYLRKKLISNNRGLIMMYQLSACAVASVAIALSSGTPFITGFEWSSLFTLLLFGGLIVGLNYFLLYGFKRFDVNAGTILLSTEVFFATLFGLIFFAERPMVHELVGSVCIFVASIMAFVDVGALASRLKGLRTGKK